MEKNSPENQFLRLKIGSDPGNMVLHNRMQQIFDILSFWKNMAAFLRKNSENLRKSHFSATKEAIFFQKLKISKICNMRLWRTIFPGSEPILSLRNWFSGEFFPFWAIFKKQKLRFWGDFPIQICENARVGPNFVASYLGSRFDSRQKWAHSGN